MVVSRNGKFDFEGFSFEDTTRVWIWQPEKAEIFVVFVFFFFVSCLILPTFPGDQL